MEHMDIARGILRQHGWELVPARENTGMELYVHPAGSSDDIRIARNTWFVGMELHRWDDDGIPQFRRTVEAYTPEELSGELR